MNGVFSMAIYEDSLLISATKEGSYKDMIPTQPSAFMRLSRDKSYPTSTSLPEASTTMRTKSYIASAVSSSHEGSGLEATDTIYTNNTTASSSKYVRVAPSISSGTLIIFSSSLIVTSITSSLYNSY